MVEATVIGYIDVDAAKGRVQALRLVTDKATYGRETFEAAAWSEP